MSDHTCPTCGGSGKIDSSCPTPDGLCGYRVGCPDCDGLGVLIPDEWVEAGAVAVAKKWNSDILMAKDRRVARAVLAAVLRLIEGSSDE